MIFGMWVHDHKRCVVYHNDLCLNLDLWPQGQIIVSFEIGQWYLVFGCMTIRWCVAYHNKLVQNLQNVYFNVDFCNLFRVAFSYVFDSFIIGEFDFNFYLFSLKLNFFFGKRWWPLKTCLVVNSKYHNKYASLKQMNIKLSSSCIKWIKPHLNISLNDL
jgi:hypothetical protein